jgi:hypothetical protein
MPCAALVAWRNRWSTGLRLLAPLLFLAMALMVQEVMDLNARLTGRTRDVPSTLPERIGSIPPCSAELFIYDKPCLDFVFTPKDEPRVLVNGARWPVGRVLPARSARGRTQERA